MARTPRDPDRAVARRRALAAAAPAGSTEGAVDWLERYRDGDDEAFSGFVREFEARLIQFFYRLCWDRARAEDLTQTLFLKMLRASARYRPEGKLSTFVFRAATNLWIDHYRSERPERQIASLEQVLVARNDRGGDPACEGRPVRHGEIAEPAMDPADQAERGEDAARLRAAVERLTTPHRLVFELAVLQQLPYAEVGAILDVPVGTVKSRMHNTVRVLRELLAEGAPAADAGFRAQGGRVG
jgi:RNA polymerase sigma-70 factor (ECF subfamily)